MIRRHRVSLALAIGLSGALTACAPGNCDPSTAGFFEGMTCQSSGAYDARQNNLKRNLASARQNLQTERYRADAAAIDANQARADEAREASRLAAIGRDNAALRRRLNAAERQEGTDAALVRQRQAELSSLERDRSAAARSGASRTEIEALERRSRALFEAAQGL